MQIHNLIFFVRMVVLYVGMAILCGLVVGAVIAPIACAGPGFVDCMRAEFLAFF